MKRATTKDEMGTRAFSFSPSTTCMTWKICFIAALISCILLSEKSLKISKLNMYIVDSGAGERLERVAQLSHWKDRTVDDQWLRECLRISMQYKRFS